MIKNGTTFSRILPYLVALLSFFAISAAYFAPQFSGKQLRMHDVTQYEGMSREIVEHQQEYDEDPQWTGAMFGGMPAPLINMQFDDSVVLRPLLEDVFGFMGRPASFLFIAMTAFFVMLLMWGVKPWPALIPAICYGLSTYFILIIGAGHITKMLAAAYAPLMLGGMAYTFRRNIWIGGALTAFFASLEIACNHPQITYYFLFVMLALWINEGVKAVRSHALPRFAKATGVLAIAALLAVGSNYAPLHYINDYGKDSMRGGTELTTSDHTNDSGLDIEYATAWSYGKMESFNMFIPDFTGGASDSGFSPDGKVADALSRYNARNLATQLPPYWGPQPMTGGPTYIGAAIIFLFVLGLFLLSGRRKWWVVAVSALALMLAWGRNFMPLTELFFNYFPGYDKFRTVAMILVVIQWSVPFLAALVLNKIYNGEITKEHLLGGVKRSLYVCGGVALFFLLLGGVLFDFSASYDASMGLPDDVIGAMREERASMLRLDSLRSLVMVGLAAAAVWIFALGKMRKWALVLSLLAIVCIDLVPVDLRFLPQSKFVDKSRTTLTPSQADEQIFADTTQGFRVLNLAVGDPFSDATTSYFHRSVGGYHGAKLQRYQDIIDRHIARNNQQVVNMLNTRYIIVPDSQGAPTAQLNADANGAAWFVDEVMLADTPDEQIEGLGLIDTKSQAIVERRFEQLLPSMTGEPDTTAWIMLTDYRSNYLKYRYSSSTEQLALFSEIYYKGWTAYIDGVEAPHMRADYILRAMALPAGDHVVEFRYAAQGFTTVSRITLIFSLLVIAAVVAAAVYSVMQGVKKRKQCRATED